MTSAVVEHTLAELARLDLILARAVDRARQDRGNRADEPYRGLYVSDADVDRFLEGVTECDAQQRPIVDSSAGRVAELRINDLRNASLAAGEPPRLDRLVELFGLSAFERDVVLVCLAAEIDLKYERVYAYLQDDVTKKRPTVDLILRLLCSSAESRFAARRVFEPDAPLLRWDLLSLHDDPGARRPVLLARYLKLDDRIVGFLVGSECVDSRLTALRVVGTADTAQLADGTREQLVRWSAGWAASRPGDAPVIYIHGRYGTGASVAASVLSDTLRRPVLALDATLPATPELPLLQRMRLAEREALLSDSILCWSGVDALVLPDIDQTAEHRVFTRALDDGQVLTMLLGERYWEPGRSLTQRPFLRLELADTTYAKRRELWIGGLQGSTAIRADAIGDIASRFRLTAGQIQDAIARARTLAWARDPTNGQMSAEDIDAACRAQAQHKLGALARKLIPRYTWDDIVLPAPQLSTLRLIGTMIRQRPVVYGEWGFDRKASMGKGVIALFAGASGTGKTMAAEILARELGLDLFRIDLSSVVNKYIGETEKNLERLFTEAQHSDAILFFDEADALFGKRSGVSDAHDRYANIETAYLLQRTEEYNGLVILASNLPKNMDDAFVRRIHFTVNFPIPDEAERLEIWRRTFPDEAPRGDDLDLEFLASRLKITGGNIRNVILAAAFLAADEKTPILMRHMVRAAAYEFQKMGKMLVPEDFGPYYDFARANGAIRRTATS